MSSETAMRSTILALPAVAAIIETRLYPVTLPQGAGLPAMTYTVVSGVGESDTQSGPGVQRRRIQFDCWAATYQAACGLADALTAGSAAKANVLGLASFLDNTVDQYEPETQRWRRIVDMLVYW
jgi:hypothetical protein